MLRRRPVLTATLSLGSAAAFAALTLLAAGPAEAHVRASSPSAVQGGYATITFTVPTESDTASTTGLTIQLPTGTPLASVSVQPKTDWTFSAPKQKLPKPITTDDGPVTEAVTRITWRASGTGIRPGEFDTFAVQAGPLPKASSITFKALQHYSDGTTVSWIQTPAPGSNAEPQYPAPTLALAPAGSTSASSSASAATPSSPGAAPTVTVTRASAPDKTSGVAVGALAVGILAVLLAAGALTLVLRRRP